MEDIRPANLVAALEGFYQFKATDEISTRKPYPVIHPSPTVGLICSNFRASDFLIWGAAIAAGVPIGLAFGAPMRIMTAKVCSTIGVFGGGFLTVQRSYARLIGARENYSEQRKYAFRPTTLVKFPIRQDPIPENILKLARE